MKMQSVFIATNIVALAASVNVSAQVMPTEEKTVSRTFPEEPGFKNDTEYKRKFEEMRKQLEALQQNQTSAQQTLQAAGGAEESSTISAPSQTLIKTPSNKTKQNSHLKSQKKVATSFQATSAEDAQENYQLEADLSPTSSAKVYGVSDAAKLESDDSMTVLPAGSFVKAKVVSGVEANTLEPYPVLLQLEYAFTGPNKTKIDLSNCFMIAKARANLSTERVIMETDTLSCVRENGEHFKTVARGYTAGEDSTFGSTGTFISKQGQVLLAAVLANIAKNAGEAIALAQQSTAIIGADRAATATNVTGSKSAFIAGKSMVDASSMIAQWYLDYAKQLIPSIAIGSGQEVHVVMLETIRVPSLKE